MEIEICFGCVSYLVLLLILFYFLKVCKEMINILLKMVGYFFKRIYGVVLIY